MNSVSEEWLDRDHGVVMQDAPGTCPDPTLTCGPQNIRYLTSDGGQTWRPIVP